MRPDLLRPAAVKAAAGGQKLATRIFKCNTCFGIKMQHLFRHKVRAASHT